MLALKLEFVILALLLFFLWNTQSLEKSRSSWSDFFSFGREASEWMLPSGDRSRQTCVKLINSLAL